MDLSAALPTFFITLREGVEATLVVGIVLAYLRQANQTRLNPWVWTGVGVGLVVSAMVGVLFSWLISGLGAIDPVYEPVVEPLLEGIFGLAAIVLLSWMLVWMTQQSKQMKGQVERAVGTSLEADQAAGWGIFGLVFFAVLREGFESVLFIAAQFQQGLLPAIGAAAGVATAATIGFLLFRFGVKINLRQFFTSMGVLLLLIVAGLVVSALGHLDTAAARLAQIDPSFANLCIYSGSRSDPHSCILGPLVWDLSRVLPDAKNTFPGNVLHTLFGYQDILFLVPAIAYVSFLLVIGGLYFQNLTGWRPRAQPSDAAVKP
jgi:high-affinity iron transporter